MISATFTCRYKEVSGMLVSQYLGLDQELETRDIFDSVIDKDSHFFINLIRLKCALTPEFKLSYNHIIAHFKEIAMLLDSAGLKNLKAPLYRDAYRMFHPKEINCLNLGYSQSQFGKAFGPILRKQVISDAFDIIKKGSKQPEIFLLVSLFIEKIGPDLLSDMIATIILPDIYAYTKRIHDELYITQDKYPEYHFKDGLIQNPYKKDCSILFLPKEILHELPIARCWDDIDRVASENESIRREINKEIGIEWHKWATRERKIYMREHIFKNPEKCARVIEGYNDIKLGSIDLSADIDYFVEKLWYKITQIGLDFSLVGVKNPNSKYASHNILKVFKSWVENNKGWDAILSVESKKREKIVQRLFHLCAKQYIEYNSLDISFEPNAGPGPADFKISRGNDKTITEIKLSSNHDYMNGYRKQVQEYGKAENTDLLIYVFIDVGNPNRLKTITEEHQANITQGLAVPDLVIISAVEKKSAST
jgi:hypothetical protein